MAVPTPTTYTRQVGHHGVSIWNGVWAGTGEFTASIIVNVSGLAEGYANVLTIKRLTVNATAGISALLEFDCTTNQLILEHPIGNTGPISMDFTMLPGGGLPKTAAGSTGDLVLTTLSAAAADAIYLYVEWKAN
eukprot:GHVU01236328.1.p1 GENE.GHVU01236328.1~~GHVU01236328.1.p1  ORF type:complete len:134 (+),score=20.99 GHVU01236328.1:139-540(+)